MSKRSQDKRRARAKEKKQAQRRKMGQSPLSRLTGTDADCECWLSTSSEDDRMRSYAVLRAVRGGGYAGAFFLIDYDCIGLKDAFVRLNIDPVEVRESLRAGSQTRGMRLTRVPVDDLRAQVAGAVAWTRKNSFILPSQWERTLKIIGTLDLDHADTSAFGTQEGGLLYVGREIDLKRRLAGVSLEEFLARPDVAYEFHRGDETFRSEEFEDEWEEDDPARPLSDQELDDMHESEMAINEMADTLRRNLMAGLRKWCIATAQPVEPAIDKAIDVMVMAPLQGMKEGDVELDEGGDEEPTAEGALQARAQLLQLEDPAEQEAIERADEQLGKYLQSLGGPDVLAAMMGFGMGS